MPGLMDSDYNATVAGRKAAFVRTMKNHPERLKGKTIEEAYRGMRQNVANTHKVHPPVGYKGQTPATAGPKAPYNGQDTATASGGKRNNKAVGAGLLGGPKAKMSAAPTQGAVERRLNKNKVAGAINNRGQFGAPTVTGVAKTVGRSVANDGGYGQSVGKSASTIGNEIKKVAGAVTKRRRF